MIKKALSTTLAVLLMLSCALCTFAAPVGLESDPNSASQLRQRTAGSPPTPPQISESPSIGITQPLRVKDLSAEELFKALVVLETHHKPRDPPRARSGGFKLPEFLDYPIFTTRDYLVQFDKSRPPVALPTKPKDLHESVHSYVFNKFYYRLNANHDGEAEGSTGWFDAVRPRTKYITISQVAKEGLIAEIRVREWADKIRRQHPQMLPEKAVDDALKKAKELWKAGMYEATASHIRFEEIASKIHRR